MAKAPDIEIPAPRANSFLLGHLGAQMQFLREFEQGKLHHAYLMTGPKGIGKATLAYRFARFLLGQGAVTRAVEEAPSLSLFGDAPAPTPATSVQSQAPFACDPESPLFRRIAGGSHTDLLSLSPLVDAKTQVEKASIGVDEARKVPEFLSMTAAEGNWRVVIVDAVDQLNINAANALLKILEEPPAQVILLLVCHQPRRILPTIRSRCRLLALSAPDATEFGNILAQVAPGIPSHEYAALYALSYGSPGHAITLYKTNGLQWYEQWLNAMKPEAGHELRAKLADAVAAQKSPEVWATVMYGWRIAMQRITTHPHSTHPAIFRTEAEKIAAIAAATPPRVRDAWVEQGEALIRETETFHLDKRQTIRLLTDPRQLDMVAA